MTALFHQRLQRQATERPTKTAFVFIDRDERERSLTFAALDTQARQVASLLRSATAPGERVLLLFPPSLDFVAAFYGSLVAGTISIAADPPDPRLGAAGSASLQASAADAGARSRWRHARSGRPSTASCRSRCSRSRTRWSTCRSARSRPRCRWRRLSAVHLWLHRQRKGRGGHP
jgi:hypothetical protein